MIGPKTARWPALTKAKVGQRDGLHCLHCGTTENLTLQHRAGRGAGGRNSAEAPANGAILCWAFNVLIEQDADAAQHARAMGWKLSDPTVAPDVPMFDALRDEWFQPDNAWNRQAVPS